MAQGNQPEGRDENQSVTISYSPDVDAFYIGWNAPAHSHSVTNDVLPGVVLDLDTEGRIHGIEIMDFGEAVKAIAANGGKVNIPLPSQTPDK